MNIQERLEDHLYQLRREQKERGARPRVIAMFAIPISRCYELLGNSEEAAQYAQMAAEAAHISLDDAFTQSLKAPNGRGNDQLQWARILWRAGDAQATMVFQTALQTFQSGYTSPSEITAIDCYTGSFYCLVFLEQYADALELARRTVEMERSSSRPNPDIFIIETMVEVIMRCQNGRVAALQEALLLLEACFQREQITLCDLNLLPNVDVYTFIQRKLAEHTAS